MKVVPSVVVIVAALVIQAACGTEVGHPTPAEQPTLEAENYSRDCSATADCVLVGVGTCGDCGFCVPAAINRTDLEKYNADAAAANCHPPAQCLVACIRSQPFACDAGACTVEPAADP